MKIRFTTSVAGKSFDYEHDQVVDLPVDQAKHFVRARQAVPHEEQAIVAAPENAAARGRGARRILNRLVGG